MANTIDWGQGAVNNTIGWGKGKTNATNNWGSIYDSTAAGETNITGSGGGGGFVNEYSMSFDGIDEYITIPTITLPTDFSISMWVKATISGSIRDQVFGGASGFFVFGTVVLNGGANANKMCYYNGSAYVALTPAIIRDGNWHNIVITYNSSATNLIAYTDGIETYNATYDAGTNNVIDRISEDTYGNYWKGNLDELAVWTSELSASDVTTIYNGGVPTDLTSLSPLSWWRMGDGDLFSTNWTFFDNGSGGNDGTSTTLPESSRLPITPNSYSQNSFVFDGSTDLVNLGNDASRKVQTLTMSVWVKPTAFASDPILLNGHPSYGNQGIEIFWNFNLFRVRINGTSYGLGAGSGQNNWTHIVISYDGNTLKRMVNGVQGADVVVGATINYTNYNGLKLGRSVYGYALGLIDEVAFWDSDQSANFSTIYGNGVPTDILSLSPLNYYRMGESATWDGANWTFVDQGSGGNDGTSSTLPESAKTGDQPYVL